MTSDERVAAIGNGNDETLLTDIETMKVNQKVNGWQPTITSDDKYIVTATNDAKDITIYQVSSCLTVPLLFH